jgi:hypothetical protein
VFVHVCLYVCACVLVETYPWLADGRCSGGRAGLWAGRAWAAVWATTHALQSHWQPSAWRQEEGLASTPPRWPTRARHWPPNPLRTRTEKKALPSSSSLPKRTAHGQASVVPPAHPPLRPPAPAPTPMHPRAQRSRLLMCRFFGGGEKRCTDDAGAAVLDTLRARVVARGPLPSFQPSGPRSSRGDAPGGERLSCDVCHGMQSCVSIHARTPTLV